MSVHDSIIQSPLVKARAMPGRPAGEVAIWHRAICNWIDRYTTTRSICAGQQRD